MALLPTPYKCRHSICEIQKVISTAYHHGHLQTQRNKLSDHGKLYTMHCSSLINFKNYLIYAVVANWQGPRTGSHLFCTHPSNFQQVQNGRNYQQRVTNNANDR